MIGTRLSTKIREASSVHHVCQIKRIRKTIAFVNVFPNKIGKCAKRIRKNGSNSKITARGPKQVPVRKSKNESIPTKIPFASNACPCCNFEISVIKKKFNI